MTMDPSARIALLTATYERHGAALLDAIAAACAIVCHADGAESASERLGLRTAQRSDPQLAALPADALSSRLAAHARAWRQDPAAARDAALRALAPVAGKPAKARLVLEACAQMPRADGRIQQSEVEAVRAVRDALGLAP